MRLRLMTVAVCLALGMAVGCGGGDDDEGGDSAATTEQPAQTAVEQAPEISMKDVAFKPTELSVKKGTTVTWTNDESIGHDVKKTGGPGPVFSSGKPGAMQKGDTFKHTFDAAGTYDYVCTVHNDMAGFVIVE